VSETGLNVVEAGTSLSPKPAASSSAFADQSQSLMLAAITFQYQQPPRTVCPLPSESATSLA